MRPVPLVRETRGRDPEKREPLLLSERLGEETRRTGELREGRTRDSDSEEGEREKEGGPRVPSPFSLSPPLFQVLLSPFPLLFEEREYMGETGARRGNPSVQDDSYDVPPSHRFKHHKPGEELLPEVAVGVNGIIGIRNHKLMPAATRPPQCGCCLRQFGRCARAAPSRP